MAGAASRFLRRAVGWPIEAALVYALAVMIRLLPAATASVLGAGLLGLVGPLTPWHRRTLFNIGYAMPELSEAERRRIARASWFNLGRVVGEFFHTRSLMRSGRVTIEGLDLLERNRRGGFLVGAHVGNWELLGAPAIRLGAPVSAVYRPANNPIVSRLLNKRGSVYERMYEKGREGARGIAATVSKGEYFAMLVDQKLREGLMLPFFGHKASTAIAHIRIALKTGAPVFLVQVVRLKGCRFHIRVSRHKLPKPSGRRGADIDRLAEKAAGDINRVIEGWIRENPDQWLWPHRRWPASKGEMEE